MDSIVIAAATGEEPVSLELAKSHCRVDVADDDALIEGVYIPAARETVEEYTGLTLVASDVDVRVAGSQCTATVIPVPVQPAQSLAAVSAIDRNGIETPLDLDEYGLTLAKAGKIISVIVARNGPLPGADFYRVQYTCGYAAGKCPGNLMLAMLEYVGDAYENRESQQSEHTLQENPRAISLMDPYRITFGV
jgi:uncharacterized phiE125 gp8 family phage protein